MTDLDFRPASQPASRAGVTLPGRDYAIWPTAAVVIGVAIAYLVAYTERSDYLGHYLVGFGATLILLSAVSTRTLDPRVVAATVFVCVICGVLAERTIFRMTITDPVDIGHQSVGASMAGIAMINRPRSRQLTIGAVVLGTTMLLWGLVVADH